MLKYAYNILFGDKLATFLLVLIFAIFVGLGIPDSAFGAALPAIRLEMPVPMSISSIVTMLNSIGTVVASFFSARLINKFGTGKVTAFSTLLTAIALVGYSLANSIWWMCVLAIPLGLGAGAIDAALNNYVAVRYSSKSMSFLHCFYGLGVILSPYVFSLALQQDNDWRLGYRIIFIIQIIITSISFLSLPLWNKVQKNEQTLEVVTPKNLTYRQIARSKAMRAAWLLFFTSVALEFTCGYWATTFLVHEGLTASNAALCLTFYYVGITAGRFISGLLSGKFSPQQIIYLGYGAVAIGIISLFLPIPPMYKAIGLLLIGLGNGPLFPNLTYLTPTNFGKDVSQSLVSSQMVVCNLGILIMPPLFSLLAQCISPAIFPIYLAVLFVIMIIANVLYSKYPKRNIFN